MEFKYRAVDEQAVPYRSPPPITASGYSYFTEQAIRAGYMGPGFGQPNEYFPNPLFMREAIQRELEKERIREEIITVEIAWRRMIEAEVRREMMIEREMALQGRGVDGFDRFPMGGAGMRYEPRGISFERREGLSLEERIAMSLEERLGMRPRWGIGESPMLPFQQRSLESKILEVVNPPSEVSKEKEKIVLLAKPETNVSGAKRKVVTRPAEGASELPSTGKKVNEEWSCALCQVSATSERGLNEHIQGKRHKSKEAALKAQKSGKNFGIGLPLKKTVVLTMPDDKVDNLSSQQGVKSVIKLLQSNQTGESSLQIIPNKTSPKENDVLLLQGDWKADNLKDKNLELKQKISTSLPYKKQKCTFWCEMCHVGTFSETAMESHRKGKKHGIRLQKARQNEAAPVPQIVGTVGMNDADKLAKNEDGEAFENVDGTPNKVKAENCVNVNAEKVNAEDHETETGAASRGNC